MEKRAILAIVLSLVVVVLWSIFFAPAPPPPPPPSTNIPVPEQQAREESRPPTPVPESSVATSPGPAALAGQPQEVTVHTGVTQLTLTSQGAGVEAVQLQDYRTTLDRNAPPVTIAPVPGAPRVPLAAELQVGQRTISLAGVHFVPSTTVLSLSQQQPEGIITFRGQTEGGLVVHRTYHFRYNSYVFEVDTRLEGLPPASAGTMTLLWGPGLLQHGVEDSQRRTGTTTAPRSYVRGKVFFETPKTVGEARLEEGTVTWTALADTYFAAVLLPHEPVANAVVVRQVQQGILEVGVRTPVSPDNAAQSVRVFVGPKQQELLTSVDPSLDKLIDLGFFSPLARPMMQLLRHINNVVHNYGVTIILVTILIKIVFWPLTQKSYKSMRAMQKLQPKMQELQVIYKNDRQALNRAMMQLYREHKVNPMGGCLPMLIQIPFFFAFYNALLYSTEMRHAPLICWEPKLFWIGHGICDLSVYDPSYITPLLMGITMFLQQRMTPTTGDPAQAKVMQFMPLMFLFFFLKAPAGLVIYWLVNNILSIAQQLVVNRSRQLEAARAEAASTG
jgi:YidC/Oxa1 family membrane protein insertase